MYPDAYDVKLLGNEHFIFMHDVNSKINPSKLEIRYDILEFSGGGTGRIVLFSTGGTRRIVNF